MLLEPTSPHTVQKGEKMADALANGAPPGSLVLCNESGWMDREFFVRRFQHFVFCVTPTAERPVVLILDGHNAHTKNVEAIETAKRYHIFISLPPHSTHWMQPLDVAFFRPLKTYYNQAGEKRLRTNPGRKASLYDVCGLLQDFYESSD